MTEFLQQIFRISFVSRFFLSTHKAGKIRDACSQAKNTKRKENTVAKNYNGLSKFVSTPYTDNGLI